MDVLLAFVLCTYLANGRTGFEQYVVNCPLQTIFLLTPTHRTE